MNFDQVIFAHSDWKNHFKHYLEGKEKLDEQTVAKDNVCELGKWLAGEGARHAQLPEYRDLKEKHTQFHLTAAQAVRESHKLPKEQSLKLVDIGTPFAKASVACVLAISKLKNLLQAKAAQTA